MTHRTVVIGLIALMTSAAFAASSYKLDPVHSAVIFRIKHVGISYTYGRFNDVTGSVAFDPASPASTTFDITIKAASVDTGNAKRDEHLRSPDFFNTGQFPTITFKSTKAEPVDADTLKVTGDLTLHGVKKPVTVEIDITGHGDLPPPIGSRAGFEAKFTIKRSEFDMKFGIDNGGAGDDVTLIVSLEALRQ